MGLESRDYVRDSPPPGGYGYGGGYGSGGGDWAVKYLLIANIVVFILQIVTGRMLGGQPVGGISSYLDLRMASVVTHDDTQFYARQVDNGVPPNRMNVPGNDAVPGDSSLDAGTSVIVIGQYGGYALVRRWGSHGLVKADALEISPLHSWQWIWRLITNGFCHGSLLHIAFNMFVLFTFGRFIEPVLGSKQFLTIFLVGVVASSLCHEALQIFLGQNIPAVGASGGLMSLVMVTAMTFPRAKVLLMFVIPLELRTAAIALVVIDLLGLLNIFHLLGSNIAYAGHLGGAAFGIAYKHFGWNFTGLFGGWSNPLKRLKRRPKLRVHQPRDEPADSVDQIADGVDRLLAKISEEGESSLTDEEREFLAEASRRFRNR